MKDYHLKHSKNSQNSTIRKQPDWKWAKNLKKQLTKEDLQMASKHMKRGFTSLVIRESQIKTRSHYIPSQMAKIHKTDIKCWCGHGAAGALTHADGHAQWHGHLGNFLHKHTLTIPSSNCACSLPQRTEKLCPHKNPHKDVPKSCIHNCQNLEAIKNILQ